MILIILIVIVNIAIVILVIMYDTPQALIKSQSAEWKELSPVFDKWQASSITTITILLLI